jgi:hypothetical protein
MQLPATEVILWQLVVVATILSLLQRFFTIAMGLISTGSAPGTSAAVGWLGHPAQGEDDGHPGLAWAGATFIRRAEAPGEGKKEEKAMVLWTFHHLGLLCKTILLNRIVKTAPLHGQSCLLS